MGRRIGIVILVAAALVIAALAAAAAVSRSDITYRAGTYRGAQTGDVIVNGEVVFSIRTGAGGLTPAQRAQVAAERLQGLAGRDYAARDVTLRRAGEGQVLYLAGSPIVSVSPAEARAHGTTVTGLAEVWRDNLVNALTGVPVPPGPGNPPPGGPPVDWTATSQKWVPIFSIEQQGLRIGAAQVAGPKEQVDQVKGVAEFRLDFRNFARIYAYVPVSTISVTKLDRVQGVSVWAIGDLGLVSF